VSQSCEATELAAQPVVAPADRLRVAHRKRMSHAYVTTEAGGRELCIYYGTKEVTFDEERLFAFGEQLVSQSSFTAESATSWGPGYDWAEVRALLEALVDEGIIQQADTAEDPRGGGLVPSRLPPSVCPVARSWSSADCEAITQALGGRAIEIGHLEAVVSSYRIAHPALDADGRQVGEANVYPEGLRLDRETEWRVCQYAGSRYRDDAPMNVTALKAMIKHWKPMMAALLEIRAELVNRLGRSRSGWTMGDLHTFSRVVLAVPAFPLMQGGGASPQPPLHPVLSSLFRITDGIRLTTHDMLFLSAERTRLPGESVTAAELYGFAERNGLFLSAFGVCAGPKPLIDEFLATVFDGIPVQGLDRRDLPAEVQAVLSQLPAVVDYGLLGLQVWGVSRSVWLAMSRATRALRELFETPAGDAGPGGRLRARLRDDWRELDRERIAADHERDVHHTVYADAYEQAWRALRSPAGPATFAERIAPGPELPQHCAVADQLRRILTSRFSGVDAGGPGGAPVVERTVEILVDYLRAEQAVLAAVTELQASINVLLDRPRPTRPLTVRDFHVTFVMNPPPISAFPYLLDMLEAELGFRVECTADTVEVWDRRAGQGDPDAQARPDPHVLRR
jgi:hypothetical protein